MNFNKTYFGDCRANMRAMRDAGLVAQTCVTSPPYFGLRDYGHDGQIGLEDTPEKYIAELVEVFRCVRDVLADDGTLWVNIGDSYVANATASGGKSSSKMTGGRSTRNEADKRPDKKPGNGRKTKDLIGIPWMLAFALRTDGWYLRQEIIWAKPNPMPESVRDRCTKAHEQIFLLSKSPRYHFDYEAIKEPAVKGASGSTFHKGKTATHQLGRSSTADRADSPTRNKRSVWNVAPRPYAGAHFAVFPAELIEPCILAGARPGDVVMDPFMGSGTTAATALKHGRRYIGFELNADYRPLQDQRIAEIESDDHYL